MTLGATACLGLLAPAHAQDVQSWNMFLVSGPVKGNIVTWTEVQPRLLVDDGGRIGQFLLRQAVGVRTKNGTDLMLGYHYQVNTTSPDNIIRENRIYAHVALPVYHSESGIELSSQIRAERRMFVGEPEPIHRIRGQLHLHLPLHGPGTIGPVFTSETMFNLNGGNNRSRSGFEQQRTSAGVYVPFGKGYSLEATYLNQRIGRLGPDTVVHVASLKLAYKLGYKSKSKPSADMPELPPRLREGPGTAPM